MVYRIYMKKVFLVPSLDYMQLMHPNEVVDAMDMHRSCYFSP
jgi:hypothetical protein